MLRRGVTGWGGGRERGSKIAATTALYTGRTEWRVWASLPEQVCPQCCCCQLSEESAEAGSGYLPALDHQHGRSACSFRCLCARGNVGEDVRNICNSWCTNQPIFFVCPFVSVWQHDQSPEAGALKFYLLISHPSERVFFFMDDDFMLALLLHSEDALWCNLSVYLCQLTVIPKKNSQMRMLGLRYVPLRSPLLLVSLYWIVLQETLNYVHTTRDYYQLIKMLHVHPLPSLIPPGTPVHVVRRLETWSQHSTAVGNLTSVPIFFFPSVAAEKKGVSPHH